MNLGKGWSFAYSGARILQKQFTFLAHCLLLSIDNYRTIIKIIILIFMILIIIDIYPFRTLVTWFSIYVFFLTSPGNNYREDDYEDNSYSNHAWNEGRGGPRGRGRGRGRGGRGRGAPGFRDRSPLGGRGELPAYMHAFMCPLDITGLFAPVNYNAVLELKFRDFMKLQREFLIIMAKKYWDVRIVMFGLLLHFFFLLFVKVPYTYK